MKKIGSVISLCILCMALLCLTACENSNESGAQEASVDAVVSAYDLGQEDVEAMLEEMAFEQLSPKDQLTVTALQYLETILPGEAVADYLPENIEVMTYCSGDLGNDGVNNMAVILENQYYGYGDEILVVAIFEETEEGDYRYLEYTDDLFLRDEDDWRADYFYDVKIEDGKLHVNDAKQYGEYTGYESVWILEDNGLVMDEVVATSLHPATGNGLETVYRMQEGTVVCSAVSLWNKTVSDMTVYEGTFTTEQISFETVDEDYLPAAGELNVTYTTEGEAYDYRRLNITDEMFGEFSAEDDWKVAYIKMMDELFKADESAGEYEYAFLYIDEDEIPELVYGHSGYWVSVCTYAPGKESLGVKDVATVMERWPYGAFGNVGYEYLPGENLMRNFDQDQAGAVRYTSYFKVGDEKETEDLYYLKSVVYDEEGNISAKGETGSVEYFYNGEREITEEEYDAYWIDGDFEYIEGNQQGYKIVAALCQGNSMVEPVWKDAYRAVIDAVTKEHEQGDSAAYELTYDLIYLDDDFIPELVIGQNPQDAWVSVYTYAYGKTAEGVENVAVLVDKWRYNYGCNYGYHYAPEEGRIEEYVELHGNGYYYKDYYMKENGTLKESWKFLCEIEWLSEAEGHTETYYRDDELFTQERWDYFMDERRALEWEFLEGTQNYDEIMAMLEEF